MVGLRSDTSHLRVKQEGLFSRGSFCFKITSWTWAVLHKVAYYP